MLTAKRIICSIIAIILLFGISSSASALKYLLGEDYVLVISEAGDTETPILARYLENGALIETMIGSGVLYFGKNDAVTLFKVTNSFCPTVSCEKLYNGGIVIKVTGSNTGRKALVFKDITYTTPVTIIHQGEAGGEVLFDNCSFESGITFESTGYAVDFNGNCLGSISLNAETSETGSITIINPSEMDVIVDSSKPVINACVVSTGSPVYINDIAVSAAIDTGESFRVSTKMENGKSLLSVDGVAVTKDGKQVIEQYVEGQIIHKILVTGKLRESLIVNGFVDISELNIQDNGKIIVSSLHDLKVIAGNNRVYVSEGSEASTLFFETDNSGEIIVANNGSVTLNVNGEIIGQTYAERREDGTISIRLGRNNGYSLMGTDNHVHPFLEDTELDYMFTGISGRYARLSGDVAFWKSISDSEKLSLVIDIDNGGHICYSPLNKSWTRSISLAEFSDNVVNAFMPYSSGDELIMTPNGYEHITYPGYPPFENYSCNNELLNTLWPEAVLTESSRKALSWTIEHSKGLINNKKYPSPDSYILYETAITVLQETIIELHEEGYNVPSLSLGYEKELSSVINDWERRNLIKWYNENTGIEEIVTYT